MVSAATQGNGASAQQGTELSTADHWEALVGARTAEQLCVAWLPILCTQIPDTQGALLLLKDNEGAYVPAAMWPPQSDLTYLRAVAEEALNTRRGALGQDRAGFTEIAYPLNVGSELLGAVVLDLHARDAPAMAAAMRQLHWGAGWLMDVHHRRDAQRLAQRLEQSSYFFDLVLAALGEREIRKSALLVVNRLAQRYACHQVQFGLEKGKSVRVEAVSQSASFDDKTNLINLACLAMNESFDQRAPVVIPHADTDGALMVQAHVRYAQESGNAALCSIPLVSGVKVIGVMLFERDRPFGTDELEALNATALALAPIVELQQVNDESLLAHARRSIGHGMSRLTDTSRAGIKLLGVAVLALLLLLSVVEIDYRVGSPAVIEGATLRAAVAPFAGYIQSAPARAGDIVKQGQVLAMLEDKDLVLERTRWQAEYEVSRRKALEAMAKNDRVELRLASAQADQALAQLNLVLVKLSRVNVLAPFDGVVVSGDLTQEIGSPTEQGKVLFQISPLGQWRVILKVDERDIRYVRVDSPGELLLTSLPGDAYPMRVSKVTPVATADEGRNYFRVEASLTGAKPALRPNMEGVAKISTGPRSVLWIWTHRLTEWLRVTVWKLLP